MIFAQNDWAEKKGSVGPGRTFGSKLRKRCENDPLALLGQAVLLGRNCENAAKMTLWFC